MIIKASAALRNGYTEISEMTKKLRAKVLQAEQERIEGAETLSVSEARKRLRDRLNGIWRYFQLPGNIYILISAYKQSNQ